MNKRQQKKTFQKKVLSEIVKQYGNELLKSRYSNARKDEIIKRLQEENTAFKQIFHSNQKILEALMDRIIGTDQKVTIPISDLTAKREHTYQTVKENDEFVITKIALNSQTT